MSLRKIKVKSFYGLPRPWGRGLKPDPRLFQIAFQATLLTVGALLRDFSLLPAQMALGIAAATATQAFWIRILNLRGVGYLSPIITGLGLSLLLRADSLWLHPLIACLAISGKFLLRVRGKHVFNPANFGVGIALLFLPGTWVSPGQWGNDLGLGVLLVALGATVASRSRRDDAAWLFLGTFLGISALRLLLLGYSLQRGWEILCHQALNGALLLFAFFMISDPMTIPNRHGARVGYAILVALVAFAWHFALFRPNGLVWALFLCTPLVPLIDRLWPGERFEWRAPPLLRVVK